MVATRLPMLPPVDEAAREREERRLERERRRRAKEKPAHHEAPERTNVSTEIIGRRDLELPVEEPPVEGELPEAQRGLARSGVIFAVERQRRFSCRCRAAWRTRFSCCLMFGIS